MDRIKAILNNKDYIDNLKKNEQAENDRAFCLHDMDHFLDVARIAHIKNLEENLGFKKDVIYAAALLHDIGKWRQYRHKIPHSRASAEIAGEILGSSGFNSDEVNEIISAILTHSKYNSVDKSLNCLLYKSDKLSRKCFQCPEAKSCKWDHKMKNMKIEV